MSYGNICAGCDDVVPGKWVSHNCFFGNEGGKIFIGQWGQPGSFQRPVCEKCSKIADITPSGKIKDGDKFIEGSELGFGTIEFFKSYLTMRQQLADQKLEIEKLKSSVSSLEEQLDKKNEEKYGGIGNIVFHVEKDTRNETIINQTEEINQLKTKLEKSTRENKSLADENKMINEIIEPHKSPQILYEKLINRVYRCGTLVMGRFANNWNRRDILEINDYVKIITKCAEIVDIVSKSPDMSRYAQFHCDVFQITIPQLRNSSSRAISKIKIVEINTLLDTFERRYFY